MSNPRELFRFLRLIYLLLELEVLFIGQGYWKLTILHIKATLAIAGSSSKWQRDCNQKVILQQNHRDADFYNEVNIACV